MSRFLPAAAFTILCILSIRCFAASIEDVTGNWVARPLVEGRQGELVLGLHVDEEGRLQATLRLPPIEAWNLPLGGAKLEGDTLLTGLGRFTYSRDNDTLTGVLPRTLVPARDVSVTMRRVERLDQPARRSDYGASVEPVWTVDTGGPVFGSPAVHDGVVYTGSDDGVLYALDSDDGEIRWRFETNGPVRARPTVHEGRILVSSDDGHLYSLTLADGRQAWKTRIGGTPSPRSNPSSDTFRYDHFSSSAVVSAGTVYVGTLDGVLVALDVATGEREWWFAAEDAITSTPAVGDGKVVFGSFDGQVYAVDAVDGSEAWRLDTGAPVVSSPAIAEGVVVVGSRSYDLYGIELSDGGVRWRFYYWFSWVESSATIVDGVAYVGSSDSGSVYAVRVADGTELWSLDTAGSAWATPAVGPDRVFIGSVGVRGYIADHKPGFYAIDRESGAPAWWFAVDHPEGEQLAGFVSSPATDGERVFVGGLDGRIYAFEAAP
jgi:outer membrane protein assembly factor BamB